MDKDPLGTEVGLDPDDIVLDGDPAPPRKLAQQPLSLSRFMDAGLLQTFRSCLIITSLFNMVWQLIVHDKQSSIPSLSLSSLLGTLSFALTLHIHLTIKILISACGSATSFSFRQAWSHFCVAYYFAHNCYTASLS